MESKVKVTLIALSVAGMLGVSAFAFPLAAVGQLQENPSNGNSPETKTAQARVEGLNFFLRLSDEETGTTSTKPVATPPTETAASDNATENLLINTTIVQGENKTQLPINATVPANAEDVELCAAIGNGSEVCQPLLLTLDLTEDNTETPGVTSSSLVPAAFAASDFMPVQSSGGLLGGGSLISIQDTTVTIPITVIVPLTVQIQDAQICASVLSSGEMNCTQIVLNPTQTSFTSVNVDLTTDTPTLSSADSATIQQQDDTGTATTGEASPTNTTGTESGSDTSGTTDSNTTTNSTG